MTTMTLVCSLTAFAQRDTIALNNNWRFTTDKKAEGVNGQWFAATLPGKRVVNLPHTWNIEDEIGHLINPKLQLSTEEQEGDEGCLSFPGLVYDCKRALSVVAQGFNMHGEPVEIVGSELMARCIQHETDHLNGILFIDKLSAEDRKLAMKEIRESEWFNLAAEKGQSIQVKDSPHSIFGRNT